MVKVMTRNLYLGAEIDTAMNVSTRDEIPAAVAALWAQVQQNDFPGRARLIAHEIAAESPDIVALQEVELFRMQSPSDFQPGAAPNAEATAPNGDMLAILQAELVAAGLDYGDPVVTASHSDTELPAVDASGASFDLRMTDRDVVFVRSTLTASNPRAENFASMFSAPLGGLSSGIFVKLSRGYASVDLLAQGVPFTFVNTHLEVGGILSTIQESQAKELLDGLAPLAGQVILAGDFNSAADGSTTKSYQTVTGVFADAWPEVNDKDPGPTCCTDLQATAPAPTDRIDLVLYRGKLRPEAAGRVGLDPSERTPGGLLASDHVGVVTTLTVGM